MKAQKQLLRKLIEYWDLVDESFTLDEDPLHIEVDDIYFLTGLSCRGLDISLAGTGPRDLLTVREYTTLHCTPDARVNSSGVLIRYIRDLGLKAIMFTINYNAGCKSAVSNIVMAITLMITLLLLTPLFYYTPVVVLSSIIVAAVLGLIDVPAAYFIWKVDKMDFFACMGAFLGVIFISVQSGLLIAVGISLFKILLHVTRPHTLLLGNIPGTALYRNVEQYKEAVGVPGFLILGIASPIYFANATYLRERILRWVQDEEDRIEKEKENTLQYVILDITAVTTIDTTGINSLLEIKKTLTKRGLEVALVNPGAGVMEKLQRANIIESFGRDCWFLTVGEAIYSFSSLFKMEPY